MLRRPQAALLPVASLHPHNNLNVTAQHNAPQHNTPHHTTPTDPASEADAAKEGAYPFTTITPNIGRGFIALPDPTLALGLHPAQVQPAHGFAPGFSVAAVQAAGFSSVGPLQQLLRDCGWARSSSQAQCQQQGVCAGACPAGARAQQQPDGAQTQLADGVLWRRLPVTLKDVAGLVPGQREGCVRGAHCAAARGAVMGEGLPAVWSGVLRAVAQCCHWQVAPSTHRHTHAHAHAYTCCPLAGAYQGRGKGNAFLADLCDADVLVHVVDASGTTDAKGVAAEAAAAGGRDAGDSGQQQQQQQQPVPAPADAAAAGDTPVGEVR
jgi:hypothetical protein